MGWGCLWVMQTCYEAMLIKCQQNCSVAERGGTVGCGVWWGRKVRFQTTLVTRGTKVRFQAALVTRGRKMRFETALVTRGRKVRFQAALVTRASVSSPLSSGRVASTALA